MVYVNTFVFCFSFLFMPNALMRFIDYWFGIPLCFLLTLPSFLSMILGLNKTRLGFPPRKVLFIKLSEMGGIILAYPLIAKAIKECPGIELLFLTFKKNAPVFNALNLNGRVKLFTIRNSNILEFLLDSIRAVLALRKERVDIVFDLELFSRFTAIISYLSAAPKRAGFWKYSNEGLYRGGLFTHKIQYNPLLHIAKLFISFWDSVKEQKKNSPELGRRIEGSELILPEYHSRESDRKRVGQILNSFGFPEGGRLIVLNPGEAEMPLRVWPVENFTGLSEMILTCSNNYLVLAGMNNSVKRGRQLCERVNNKRCIDLTGKTTLEEVLELLDMAAAFVSSDCGLAHLASLTKTKGFVIFGPESPQVYAPLSESIKILYSESPCSPCFSAFNHRQSFCRNNICLKSIKAEEVYAQFLQYVH